MSKTIKQEDVQFHCRCCLKKVMAEKSLNISKMPRPLFQLFRYCTGFRTWQKGIYPDQVCEQCHELLKSFENFEKLCKETAYVLEELLNGQKFQNQTDAEQNEAIQLKENVPNQSFPFEKIDVKPEIINENIPKIADHIDSDVEDALALAEINDDEYVAKIKTEDAANDFQSMKEVATEGAQIHTNLNCKAVLKLKNHTSKTTAENPLNDLNEEENILEQQGIFEDQKADFGHGDTKADHLSLDDLPQDKLVVELNTTAMPVQEQEELETDLEDTLTLNELVRKKTKRAVYKRKPKSISTHLKDENEDSIFNKIDKAKVACEQCPRKFKWPFELRRHIKEMHGDKPLELPCKYDCGKIFHSQNTLKSHYRINHQMKKQIYRENAYICEQCGKGFKRLPLLERHRFHHMPVEARPYKCEQCGKAFVMERIYKEHLLRHSGNKKFECHYCGIKKATMGEYREHINIHTKEKEYACEMCPKIFYRSKNLVQHVSAVHQGIKKHFCRFCQHSFANHINLVHHERIHTGEKPYACEICKRSFIQPSALKTHMKTHDETRVKAKVGRKPKNKSKEEYNYEGIVNNNADQQMTRCTE